MDQAVGSDRQADVVSYGTCMNACAKSSWRRSLQLLMQLQARKLLPNVVICAAAVKAPQLSAARSSLCQGLWQWQLLAGRHPTGARHGEP